MKILLAPNSYKEVIDASEAAHLFTEYFNDYKLITIEKPISDGGDAFLNICKERFKLERLSYDISKSYDDDTMSIEIGYDEKKFNVYVESAEILGLKLIPKEKRNPSKVNSKGLGDLLKLLINDVEKKKLKVEKVFIGIGGTGTNDLALGACSRFGLRIFEDNKELEIKPINYFKVKRIEWEEQKLPFKIITIVDVKNKLLGKSGATLTFGKQKGAGDQELKIIEKGFKNVINILKNMSLVDSEDKLSGAGGGLAAGLSILLNAETKKAKDFILQDLRVAEFKNKVDYLITGEGSFDQQSLMEKGTGILIDEFKNSVKKIFLVCGKIDSEVKLKLDKKIYCIELTKYFKSKEESLNNFEKGIELACKEIQHQINLGNK